VRNALKSSSARRIETCIEQLKPYFTNVNIHNISRATCDEWVTRRGAEIQPRAGSDKTIRRQLCGRVGVPSRAQ
jgi:hypothetical protein